MKKKYKSGLIITSSIVVLTVILTYFVVGCGQRNPYYDMYGPHMGGPMGPHAFQGTGYNPGGHVINLTLAPQGHFNPNQTFNPMFLHNTSWSGPVNIIAQMHLAYDLGRSYLFNGSFGGHQYNHGYHPQASRPFDNCTIPMGQYRVFTEYPATMQGTSFGNYQLVAHGPGGVVLLMSPINPKVAGSFIGGYNLGSPYVFMDLIVERADQYGHGGMGGHYQAHNLRYCMRHRITFGAR